MQSHEFLLHSRCSSITHLRSGLYDGRYVNIITWYLYQQRISREPRLEMGTQNGGRGLHSALQDTVDADGICRSFLFERLTALMTFLGMTKQLIMSWSVIIHSKCGRFATDPCLSTWNFQDQSKMHFELKGEEPKRRGEKAREFHTCRSGSGS